VGNALSCSGSAVTIVKAKGPLLIQSGSSAALCSEHKGSTLQVITAV